MNSKVFVLVCALMAAAAAARATNDVQTLSGFRVPTYDDQGVMTSQMFGDFAKVLPDGMVEILELRMEFYDGSDESRETDMVVTSPKCFYNRGKGLAFSDESVRISRDNMIVTGNGFRWSSADERLRIVKNSKVVLRNVMKEMKKEGTP